MAHVGGSNMVLSPLLMPDPVGSADRMAMTPATLGAPEVPAAPVVQATSEIRTVPEVQGAAAGWLPDVRFWGQVLHCHIWKEFFAQDQLQ